MPDPQHIDEILRDWPFDPQAVSVRVVLGSDGREVIQLRVEMGVLQLETRYRPDGERPGGHDTYYDYLANLQLEHGEPFLLTEEQCNEADREFMQFYHRRICWLALQNYQRAVVDADHSLKLMDFCTRHSPDDEWTESHEQFRTFVLFHRTQAAALSVLKLAEDRGDPPSDAAEIAIQELNTGLDRIRESLGLDEDEEDAVLEEDELARRLIELRESLRERYDVGRTLQERLSDAVAAEQYELAARLRDELAKRGA